MRQFRFNATTGKWGQVKIGDVLIPQQEFVFLGSETEETVFPSKCSQGHKRHAIVPYSIRYYWGEPEQAPH